MDPPALEPLMAGDAVGEFIVVELTGPKLDDAGSVTALPCPYRRNVKLKRNDTESVGMLEVACADASFGYTPAGGFGSITLGG